jgi:hypothetical protein
MSPAHRWALVTLLLAPGLAACGAADDELAGDELAGDGLAEEARATTAKPGTPRGVLGGYERGRVWGWAQIVGDPEAVTVRIEVDGEPVAQVLADDPREDLVDKGLHSTGAAGFSIDIDPLEPGAAVDAFIDHRDAALTNGPCVVQGRFGVSSCTEGMARGVLGGYRDGQVWGWAQLIGEAEPVVVRIEIDGEPVATIVADQPRQDLFDKRLHHNGNAGFRAHIGALPEGVEIEAIIVEQNARLTGAPLTSPSSSHRAR